MRNEYKEKIASKIAARYADLEVRIMQDIVRRIKKTGEITSTADWQINRLKILGYSSEDIENALKDTLNASYLEMFELYDKVIDWEYVRNKDIYEQINAEYIPFEENKHLIQVTSAIKKQSLEDLENITRSLGFYLDYGGRKVLTPLSQVYSGYLDNACMDIVTGAFDYNAVLRRVVTQLTNSGLRQIEYSSGYASRIEVAARRAVMTGLTQLSRKIAEYNAEKLGTEYFEVEWHAGARPTHTIWQGRVWSQQQLYDVCGLGTVTGLCGANCYHTYFPFVPGVSVRTYTDDWLDEQNRKESEPTEFRGKEYTLYEAKQRQRQMETAMRAQREKVQLLQKGGADPQEVMLQKAQYQGQLNEYAVFSRKMGLKEERERIYIDGRGRISNAKYKRVGEYIEKPFSSDIIELKRKASDPRKGLKFISDDVFNNLTIAVKKKGAIIIRGTKEAEEHLEKQGAAASIVGDALIFRKDVCISEVLEETYHFEQNIAKMNDDKGEPLRSILNEIDAKQYLLDNANKYKIPRNEIEVTQKQLVEYQKQLEKFRKGEL
ncbi:phage minor capsid protein [[Ruminococcus] lactaris]|uniref:phage minor capsid protein n=1 Tax=[Ruminococcus] lactaris TaxID=46228 RepID=UPI003FD6C998